MSGWTQGTWKVRENGTAVEDEAGKTIVLIGVSRPTEEKTADAKLIASAPKLYKALNELIEKLEHKHIDFCSYCKPSDTCKICEFNNHFNNAREALAEADGTVLPEVVEMLKDDNFIV